MQIKRTVEFLLQPLVIMRWPGSVYYVWLLKGNVTHHDFLLSPPALAVCTARRHIQAASDCLTTSGSSREEQTAQPVTGSVFSIQTCLDMIRLDIYTHMGLKCVSCTHPHSLKSDYSLSFSLCVLHVRHYSASLYSKSKPTLLSMPPYVREEKIYI